MPRFRVQLPPLPALLAVVVALALANPFCCHLLPMFQAEAAQLETAFDARDAECAGKPEAVTEASLAVLPPVLLALWQPATVATELAGAVRPADREAAPETSRRPGLFGILRL